MGETRLARFAASLVSLAFTLSLGACAGTQEVAVWNISGTVSGAVSQGVTVTLTGESGATTTTDASGNYAFAGLADGNYTLTPSLAGYSFNPPNWSVTLSGADVGGQDFTASVVPHAISGTVSGAVSQGVTVTLTGASRATTTTDVSGHYAFAGLATGTYTIMPSLPGYTFTPANRSWILHDTDVSGQDFTAYLAVAGTFNDTGSMTVSRAGHSATRLVDGTVLVAGGYNWARCIVPGCSPQRVFRSAAELYNPATGAFAATGSMNLARYGHTATRLPSGMVLVAGGCTQQGSGLCPATATAELYDPATGTFAATGSMTVARNGHTATLLPSGNLLVVSGSTAELYDPASGTFTATGSMTVVTSARTATLLLNGLVLVTGGSTTTAELYDPATGTFAVTGSMTVARSSATLLPSGMVLLAGGTTATAELYDPATGTFTATGNMTVPLSSLTATLLPSGKVLVVSGVGATAELYDPASGTFTTTGSMTVARYGPTATLLLSGRVLVAGGRSGPGLPFTGASSLRTTELYNP